MITLTTAQNALKTVYLEALSAELNARVDPVFSSIKQSSADVYGRNIVKLVPYGINGGVGVGEEDGALPISRETNYVNFTTTLKNLYGSIEITDKAIRASSNDEGAFINLLSAEMESLLEASKYNLARMFYGDGTGSITKITNINANAKIMGVALASPIIEGMVLDFYIDGILDPGMQGVVVTAVDYARNMITLDKVSASFISANTSKYKFYMQNSKDRELTGLGALFDPTITTIYGINKADYSGLMPRLKIQATGETFDEMFIQTAIDNIEMQSGYQPNLLVASANVYYKVINMLAGYTKNLDVANLQGGFTSVMFSGIPLIRNRFCPDKQMMLLNTDMFTLHQLCDWEWLTYNDGAILSQKEGYPIYTATLVKYADLICDRLNAQGLLTIL